MPDFLLINLVPHRSPNVDGKHVAIGANLRSVEMYRSMLGVSIWFSEQSSAFNLSVAAVSRYGFMLNNSFTLEP
jgi:hypothetical protein